MFTSGICLYFLLLFIHYATPKIYIVELTNESHEDGNIKLHKMLKLFEKTENRFVKDKQDKRYNDKRADNDDDDDDCLTATTRAEKIKCLENIQKGKKTIGRETFFYPGLYHEFYTQRPKRTIYSLYNVYGGLLKSKPSFTDLTRQQFSQDYLDVGELSRIERQCIDPECLQEVRNRYLKRKLGSLNSVTKPQRRSRQESSSDESSASDSDKRSERNRKHRRPNRFQVVFNDESSLESEEEKKPQKSFSSESDETKKSIRESSDSHSDSIEVTERPKTEKYSYLQGNKLYDSFRRRLQHFLPKRFHWDEDDIHHLGYYWFNGPRGKYS